MKHLNYIKMKRNILLIGLVSILCSLGSIQAQEINFKTLKGSFGTMDKRLDGIYSWGAWSPESIEIQIDLNNDSVYVDDVTFGIVDRPRKWMIKKNMKFVSFACADRFYNKVNVKLYQYDSGEFRVYIMEEKKAKKYVVKYLGNEELKPIRQSEGPKKKTTMKQ